MYSSLLSEFSRFEISPSWNVKLDYKMVLNIQIVSQKRDLVSEYHIEVSGVSQILERFPQSTIHNPHII